MGPFSVASVYPVGLMSGCCVLNIFQRKHPGGQLYQVPELPEAMFVMREEQIPKVLSTSLCSSQPVKACLRWGY